MLTLNLINLSLLTTASSFELVQPRKAMCSDDLSEIKIFYKMNDDCVKKHQFVCLEIDLGNFLELKCRILNRSFDCRSSELFCAKPLETIFKVLNRRIENKSTKEEPENGIGNKFKYFELYIDNNDNLRNGSFDLTSNFIEIINKFEVENLALKNLNLTRLPLFNNLNALKDIRISDNNISKLGSRSFFNLSNLYYLDLQNNNIQILKEMAFDALFELEDLNLSNNLLTSIPKTFHNLLKLKELKLSNNRIQSINPYFFGNDNKEFKSLDLTGNLLKSLNSIENLQYLEFLTINENKIEKVNCTALYTLKNVQMLELDNNQIRRFDCDLDQLPSLYSISLKGNQLSNLPKSSFFNFLNQTKNLAIKGELFFLFFYSFYLECLSNVRHIMQNLCLHFFFQFQCNHIY